MSHSEALVTEVRRICRGGVPLTAERHPVYGALIRLGRWDQQSYMTVGKRRVVERVLASGAVQRVLIDDMVESAPAVERYMPPILASASVEISANRAQAGGSQDGVRHYALLSLNTYADGATRPVTICTRPVFDDTMLAEVSAAWQAWGVGFYYDILDDGRRAFSADLSPNFEARLLSALGMVTVQEAQLGTE